MHEQLLAVLSNKQGNLTNAQWYERFNTRYEVAKSVGVEFDKFECLWEYCARLISPGIKYAVLSPADQLKARENAEERYLAYIFIQNSAAKHDTLRRELSNDYTRGSNHYPENRSTALMFLDKYTTSTPPPVTSEGTAFAQKGKKGKKGKDEDKDTADADKTKDNPYANMTCFKCNKKGHPAKKCPEKEKDADDASISSKGSKTSLKSLEKTMKSVQKSFAQLQAAAENSDDEDEEQSHFQYLQLDKTLSRVHFKQSQGMTYERSYFWIVARHATYFATANTSTISKRQHGH